MIKSEFCATLIKVCCRLSKVIIGAIGFNGIFLWIRIRILHNKPENSYTEYQIYFTKQIALRTAKTSEQMHMNLKATWSSSEAGSILHFYMPPTPTATPTVFLQWSHLGPLPLSPRETPMGVSAMEHPCLFHQPRQGERTISETGDVIAYRLWSNIHLIIYEFN